MACADADPEEFFYPEGGGGGGHTTTEEVQRAAVERYCNHCPVWFECLSYALRTYQRHGAWGSMTEEEIRRLAPEVHGTAERGRRGCVCRHCTEAVTEARKVI